MSHTHENHDHQHGPDCEHTGIEHAGHVDYLHDGHLHHMAEDGSVVEHSIEVSEANPDSCTPAHQCGCHDSDHVHGPGLVMNRSHTEITLTTLSMVTFIIRMAITVMTMVPSRWLARQSEARNWMFEQAPTD